MEILILNLVRIRITMRNQYAQKKVIININHKFNHLNQNLNVHIKIILLTKITNIINLIKRINQIIEIQKLTVK